MYQMRDGWTDERMDDFAKHVDQRFDAVDQRFDAVDKRFDAVDQRFEGVDQRFDAVERRMKEGFDRVDADMRELRKDVNTRFEGLQRTLLLTNGAIIAALIGVIATQA
jgi:DNA anti-recombination protein RmuC